MMPRIGVVRKKATALCPYQGEDIGLDDVARAVHTSTFHFCKMFKRVYRN